MSAAVTADKSELFASVSREDLIDLCIFLARYQAQLQNIRSLCGMMTGDDKAKAWETVMFHWPVIQGSRNQIHLLRIGELEYDDDAVSRAVKGAGEPAALLAAQKAKEEGEPSGAKITEPTVRRFRCLGMDSLDRLIRRGEDEEECRWEWRTRYGHDWPVYASANGAPQVV